MSDPNWTEALKELLQHEAFMAKVVGLRKAADENDISPSFLRLMESTGVTAIITIVLGSILAPIVITSIQNDRARNDQALAEYKQYLERQQDTVRNAYDLVGKILFASQGLVNITKPEFGVERSADPQTLKKQKTEMVEKFNATYESWQVEEEKLGLLMSYYHYGQPNVLPAWRQTQRSVNEFIQCARDRYHAYQSDPEVVDQPDKCQPKKDAVRSVIDVLAANIDSSRQYAWQQLDVPAPLRQRPSGSPMPSGSPT